MNRIREWLRRRIVLDYEQGRDGVRVNRRPTIRGLAVYWSVRDILYKFEVQRL